jgi:hypothetical protein
MQCKRVPDMAVNSGASHSTVNHSAVARGVGAAAAKAQRAERRRRRRRNMAVGGKKMKRVRHRDAEKRVVVAETDQVPASVGTR